MKEQKKFKIDMHVHTNESDGMSSPKEVIDFAKEIGLDGIAITDHDNFRGFEKIKEEKGILILPAVEITTPRCDILCYNVSEVFEGDVESIIKQVNDAGGATALPHAFGGFWPDPVTNDIDIVKKFDAIEVYNAMTPLEANVEAMELAKKLKKPGIAGSDSHHVKTVADAFTIFKDVTTSEDIVKAIKNGQCVATWL